MRHNPPTNFADLLECVYELDNEYRDDKKYVIRTLYTQNDLQNLIGSQRQPFMLALSNLVQPGQDTLPPGVSGGVTYGQTDYYWSRLHRTSEPLINIATTIAGRRF